MKRIPTLTIPLLLVLVLLSGCKLSDLRSPEMKAAIDADGSEQRGKKLLQTVFLAHGADKWENYETVTFDFEDRFMKLKFASPLPGGGARMKLDYVPVSYDGRMEIMDGKKKGEVWGHAAWHSWKSKAGTDARGWNHSKKIKFWLPTWQYFIQLPFKIQEADLIRYGGQRELMGTTYDVVFASWNTDEPQKDMDQYAMYIHPETRLIDVVEYTVRGAGKSFIGACIYGNYSDENGIKVPGEMKVLGPSVDYEKKSVLHMMQVHDVKFDDVPVEELELDPMK